MSSVALSDLAAQKAGQDFDRAAHDQIAESLKKQYVAVRVLLGSDKSGLPSARGPNDNSIDPFVDNLAEEVRLGESDRAKKIREFLKTKDPAQYEQLENMPKYRKAAVDSAKANTGDYEFLGGSTVLNALSSLFQWIFSGFSGGFGGLKSLIATNAATNAVNSFREGLEAQHIDVNNPATKKVMEQFDHKVKVAAGLAKDDTTPTKLSDIKIEGAVELPPAPSPPAPGETRDVTVKRHFESLADSLNATLGALSTTPEEKKAYEPLFAAAKESLVKHGQELVNAGNADKPGFNEKLLLATLNDVKAKLPDNDEDAKKVFDKLITELQNQDAKIEDIRNRLASSKDPVEQKAGMLLGALKEPLEQAQPALLTILAGDDPKAKEAAQKAARDQKEREAAGKAQMKNDLKKIAAREIKEGVGTALTIQGKLDKAINDKIASDFPSDPAKQSDGELLGFSIPGTHYVKAATNYVFVGDRTAKLLHKAPQDEDRRNLAEFISKNMPDILTDEVNKFIDDPNMRKMDIDKITDEAMKRFGNAFDNDPSLSQWKEYRDAVMDTLKQQIKDGLTEHKEEIEKGKQFITPPPGAPIPAPPPVGPQPGLPPAVPPAPAKDGPKGP